MNAFSGDSFLASEVKRLIRKHNIYMDTVETGTEFGHTALELARMSLRCFTIESSEEKYRNSFHFFGRGSCIVIPILGDSQAILSSILPHIRTSALFYLDAHTAASGQCCLVGEMKALSDFYNSRPAKPVIVIHDCKVPGRDDLGYDTYGDYCIELPLVREYMDTIYGQDKWSHHYNDKAEGALRGVLFVEPV